ncbi:hypothetical protein RJ640_013826 [Escallonia rubra]|uniref:Exocyst subunit Exo70 family protein n=1 Tax=Escallonia rubra TaxID=112253 RepID=A0AA88UJD7_9ASTE|nr:hypothetical protein RJ640_013826 [Escallonia rubra]
MGDTESIIPAYDGEQHVIVAAQHIVKALAASQNLSDEMRKILADLDTHLSTMTKLTESEARWTSEVEDLLRCAQKKVINWQSNKSMIWDSGPQGVAEYLQAVDEVRRLTESLGSLLSSTSGKEKELLDLAHSVLQMAMARLEEELIHILARNNLSFEQICSPARSFGGVDEELAVSTEDDSVEEKSRRASSGTESEESIIDLVRPDVISDIKSIAHIMFASSYNQEFCEAFVSFWKDALDEYLVILGVDKLSIEDVMDMEWGRLYRRIRRWCRASKVIIRFFLASQKRLFDQVLGELGSPSLVCFIEASKVSMLRLLNFGEAVAIGPYLPERLSCFIDMYEVLASLLQDIDALFNEGDGCFIRNEFHELLTKLGDSVRATFAEFGNRVASDPSVTPFPKGGIHPLTKYVMNYINLLAEHGPTLNLLLERHGEDSDPVADADIFCPMADHLRSVTSMLETNLDRKSNLFRDGSLKHFFMMNNIHYMVQKVKDSELRGYYGDEWIRRHTGKFQQHATNYERATWSSILALLRFDGKKGKAEERCIKGFTVAFEEVYKYQTGWFVHDPQLREDLRISASQNVIHAYRTFIGLSSINDKCIKYTTTELENHILDLFEGFPRSLR